MTVEDLRAGLAYVESEMRRIHEEAGDEPLDEETSARFEEGVAYINATRKTLEREEARSKVVESLNRGEMKLEPEKTFNVIRDKGDPFDLSKLHRDNNSPEEARRDLKERARRIIGEHAHFDAIEDRQREEVERKLTSVRHDRNSGWSMAEHVLRTSSPAYVSGWSKMMGPDGALRLTDEERAALVTTNDRAPVLQGNPTFGARAASLTTTAGGFLVPTILDPTVILNNAGQENPFREISNVKSVINDNGWVGVASTGVTASWDTEGSEVSDDAPTFSQPSVAIHKAAAFVPGSIEIFEDAPTLVGEIGTLIVDAKDRLEEAAFATGSGTNQPFGIVTALVGSANYTAMATNSAFAIGDVFTAQQALGARYQRNAVWAMNLVHINDIREMGGTNYYTRTVTLDSLALGEVLGKRVYESTTMSSTLDGDTNNNIVYGDFGRSYVIADRVGLRTEFIPHLFATGNNRPSGQRGIYAYWRTGADSVNDTGFVLLYNPST